MFFITNTDASINLEGCTFIYGSGTFLSAKGTTEWGDIRLKWGFLDYL